MPLTAVHADVLDLDHVVVRVVAGQTLNVAPPHLALCVTPWSESCA